MDQRSERRAGIVLTAGDVDTNTKLNFESVNILLLEQSVHALEIMQQMLFGFGARNFDRTVTIDEAKTVVGRKTLDLITVDPNLKEGDGLAFVRWLRKSGLEPNRFAPLMVLSANGSNMSVMRARDAGASFFIVKPITPAILMDRILRVIRDKRPFVVADNYAGPDRRFKFEGPPVGEAPRRSTDLDVKIGEAREPNLSQDELDSLFKPQKVSL